MKTFVVVCRSDAPGFEYVLSTRTLFNERDANRYASTIASGRYPRVMSITDYLTGYCGWRTTE